MYCWPNSFLSVQYTIADGLQNNLHTKGSILSLLPQLNYKGHLDLAIISPRVISSARKNLLWVCLLTHKTHTLDTQCVCIKKEALENPVKL